MSKLVLAGVVAVALAGGVAALQGGAGAKPEAARAPATSKPLPRLVDVGAGTCIPCKAMAPILEELKEEYAGRMEVVFIDVWKDRDAGDAHGIHMIPTQIFYGADGKELARHEGFMGKGEILAKWKAVGVSF